MDINLNGNPGTGNTFMEIHIQHVDNFYSIAPPNNNNGTRTETQATVFRPASDTALLRSEILAYVSHLRTFLADGWKGKYQQIWEDILDLDAVSASVYIPGKQQGTNFNRSLVANIIHYLDGRGAYGTGYNAARFAECLEGDRDHSVRSALGKDPADDIVSRLNSYFEL